MSENCRIYIIVLLILVFKAIAIDKISAQNTTNTISQHSITSVFDKEYNYGQFTNGNYWVLGPVKIIDITLRSVISGGRTINGSMLNHALGKQGFDNWMLGTENNGWDANLNVGRPNGTDISAANPLNIISGSIFLGNTTSY